MFVGEYTCLARYCAGQALSSQTVRHQLMKLIDHGIIYLDISSFVHWESSLWQ